MIKYKKKAHRTHQQNIKFYTCSLRVCSNYRLRENQSQEKYLKKEKRKKEKK